MLKRRLLTLLLTLYLAVSAFSAQGIPEKIGPWRIEVGSPGNEFYRPPKTIPEDTPPSEAVLGIPAIFVPHLRVTDWKIDDGEYEIECEKGNEQYQSIHLQKSDL